MNNLLLALKDERVPLFDVTVIEFIIGAIAFFVVAWIVFYLRRNIKGAAG